MDVRVAMELGKAFAAGLRYMGSREPEMAEDKRTLGAGGRRRPKGGDAPRRRHFGSAPDKKGRVWITVRGNHIPIDKNGNPASAVGRKIFKETRDEHDEKKQLDKNRHEARKTELGFQTTERNTRYLSKDPKDLKWKGRSDRILGEVPMDPNAPVERAKDLLGVQKTYEAKIEDGLKNIGPMLERLSDRLGFSLLEKGWAVKGGESAAKKLLGKYMKGRGLTAEQAAEVFPDFVRFTAYAPHRRLVSTSRRLISELDRRGYKVTKVENKYIGNDPDTGLPRTYKGIHLDCLSPNGTKFELQVHSPRSMEVKHQNHPTYKEAYDLEHSPEWGTAEAKAKYDDMQEKMRNNAKRLYSPRGVTSLRDASGSAVKVPRYRGQNRRRK